MKKLITIALASCFALSGCFALAACGGGTDYDHTIVFYSSQGDALATVTEKAIEAFEAKYPGWKVEHSQPGGYDEVLDKVRKDLTGNLQPDLAYCYADHVAQYIESGKVVDMSKYLTHRLHRRGSRKLRPRLPCGGLCGELHGLRRSGSHQGRAHHASLRQVHRASLL